MTDAERIKQLEGFVRRLRNGIKQVTIMATAMDVNPARLIDACNAALRETDSYVFPEAGKEGGGEATLMEEKES